MSRNGTVERVEGLEYAVTPQSAPHPSQANRLDELWMRCAMHQQEVKSKPVKEYSQTRPAEK